MDSTFIYALCEPDTGEIRYIGKADNPRVRLTRHLLDKRINHRVCWIRGLKLRGKKPMLKVLNRVLKIDWEEWERTYIRNARFLGMRLLNISDGGDCGPSLPGKRNPNFGKEISEKQKEMIRRAQTGRKHSPEHIEMCRAKKLGKIRGPNQKPFSPESKKRMSEARFQMWENRRNQNVLLELWK